MRQWTDYPKTTGAIANYYQIEISHAVVQSSMFFFNWNGYNEPIELFFLGKRCI